MYKQTGIPPKDSQSWNGETGATYQKCYETKL